MIPSYKLHQNFCILYECSMLSYTNTELYISSAINFVDREKKSFHIFQVKKCETIKSNAITS